MSDDSLEKFDVREIGYSRIQLEPTRISPAIDLPKQARIWTYVGNINQQPSLQLPIAQSYLDVIIEGCLNYGQDFVETFFENTSQWIHLVDDRHKPRCKKHTTTSYHHEKCDALLAHFISAPFTGRLRATEKKAVEPKPSLAFEASLR